MISAASSGVVRPSGTTSSGKRRSTAAENDWALSADAIVAEVLLGLLKGDRFSYVNADPTWVPHLPAAEPGNFTLADLVTFTLGPGASRISGSDVAAPARAFADGAATVGAVAAPSVRLVWSTSGRAACGDAPAR